MAFDELTPQAVAFVGTGGEPGIVPFGQQLPPVRAHASSRVSELVAEPRARGVPVIDYGADRHAERLGRLFDAETAEEAQLNDLAGPGVDSREGRQGIFERKDVHEQFWRRDVHALERGGGHAATTFDGASGTRGVHQYPPHHPRRGREEVGPVLPSDDAPVEEPNVGLLHEVCRLPPIGLTLARQHPPCHAAKFEVHERGELFQSLLVSAAPRLQQAGQVRDVLGHYRASLPVSESVACTLFLRDSACVGERTPAVCSGRFEGGHMRRMAWVAAAVATVAVGIGGARVIGADGHGDERGRSKPCSEATVAGDYGIQIQGTRPAPGVPGGPIESVIGVVLRTYDGHGNFDQVSNLKGSISGTNPQGPDSQSFGTYEVNPDCSGIIRAQPLPGVVVEERMVIVDDGREIRAAVMTPTPVVITSVHQRIHRR